MLDNFNTKEDFLWIEPNEIQESILDCKGKYFEENFDKLRKIISFQMKNGIIKGLKGFLLHGPPGLGKTLLAKVVAKKLNVPLLFIDGADIARGLYGQSEQQIQNIFKEASSRKAIILFDDVESIFPKRGWMKEQSWHVAQNNILFHTLDSMDTSKTTVIMTTNKFELIDDALLDRLEPIEFTDIDIESLLEIADEKCKDKAMDSKEVLEYIQKHQPEFKSVRAIEKYITKKYIDDILEKK
jgi:SpoVK/Ycf46/Vps4 family AAA+-type ATPase